MRTIDQVGDNDLDEILTLARDQEQAALDRWSAIPAPREDALRQSLERVLRRGTGVISRDNGNITGYFLAVGPIPDFRPGTIGAYSPLAMCGVAGDDIDRTFTSLLRETGNVPALAGVTIAALTCFSHHADLNASLMQNGFGVRCADAIIAIDDLPTDARTSGFPIYNVHWRDAIELLEIKQSLAHHLTASPVHMPLYEFTPESLSHISEERQSDFFVVRAGDHIIGFIEATRVGENYLTHTAEMRSICGAAVLPEYQGQGVMQALLVQLAHSYRDQGIRSLGVDYETINPEARAFWERYFTPYTRSWERHFDTAWGAR